jgi:hypothetical protein
MIASLLRQRLGVLTALCVIAALQVGCSGGSGGGGSSVGSGGTGTLSLSLTDATTLDYQAVYVTIDRVDVHLGGNESSPNNWETVARPEKTYNLLELVNGVREELGLADLQDGDYTQMRLIIGDTPDDGLNIFSQPHPFANYVILADTDEIHELKVPSGPQTGIKLVHGFTIEEGQTTELILDFDACRSVVKAGASGLWLLKPTIKVVDTKDYAIISGIVRDDKGPLPGVLVSAQIYDPEADDPKDRVVVWTSTVTDDNGEFKLFLQPGTYNIVPYTTDYFPEVVCSVTLDSGDVIDLPDFALQSAPTGTISGDVSITGADTDQHATISFRQFWDCDGNLDTEDDIIEFEVISVNVIDEGTYYVTLPVGFYDLVASTFGKTTVVNENVEVPESLDSEYDINI